MDTPALSPPRMCRFCKMVTPGHRLFVRTDGLVPLQEWHYCPHCWLCLQEGFTDQRPGEVLPGLVPPYTWALPVTEVERYIRAGNELRWGSRAPSGGEPTALPTTRRCTTCHTVTDRTKRGRCDACYAYWYRYGRERPAQLWGRDFTGRHPTS